MRTLPVTALALLALAAPAATALADGGPPPPTAPAAPDTKAPTTVFQAGPSGAVTPARALFGFAADEPATFECRDDSMPRFVRCAPPFAARARSAGKHVLRVRARDLAGNVGKATIYTFTLRAVS